MPLKPTFYPEVDIQPKQKKKKVQSTLTFVVQIAQDKKKEGAPHFQHLQYRRDKIKGGAEHRYCSCL